MNLTFRGPCIVIYSYNIIRTVHEVVGTHIKYTFPPEYCAVGERITRNSGGTKGAKEIGNDLNIM